MGIGGIGLVRLDRLLDRFYQDSVRAFFIYPALQLSRLCTGCISLSIRHHFISKKPGKTGLPR